MDELIAFVRRCLDQDERVALQAPGPAWIAAVERSGSPGRWRGINAELVTLPADPAEVVHEWEPGAEVVRAEPGSKAVAHIARWDPARVLAEVEAKRQILDLCAPEVDEGTSGARIARLTIHMLARPYAGRAAWREEWRA